MTVKVYFNNGENASLPWHVGLHDGISMIADYGKFADPIAAIKFAFSNTPSSLPVIWPDWLKVVIV